MADNENAYVEVKARQYIDSTLAKSLVKKGIVGLITTGKISGPAKEILNAHKIAWAENVTEAKFKEKEAQELG